jgi:hypothetical protein
MDSPNRNYLLSKSHNFIFSVVFLSYYKFVERRIFFFCIEIFIFPTLGLCCLGGGCTTYPPPPLRSVPLSRVWWLWLFRLVTSASVFVVPEAFYVAEKAMGNLGRRGGGGGTSFVVGWAVICVTVGTFKASRQLRNMSALVGI